MSNFITYNIELTPENIELIDKLNSMLLPNYNGESETKESKKPTTKTETKSDSSGTTLATVKTAVKKAKKAFSDEHVINCASSFIDEVDGLSIAKIVSAIDESDYSDFISALNTAPIAKDESDDDDFEESDDDDFEDEVTISVDDVKDAVKALAKDKGKDAARDAMKKVKIGKLSEISDLSEKSLEKLMKLVS